MSDRVWVILKIIKYKLSGKVDNQWVNIIGIIPKYHYNILNKLKHSLKFPLSASTTHIIIEANHYKIKILCEKVFLYPYNIVIFIGLISSLHNNKCIDMSSEEENKITNIKDKDYKVNEYIRFICAGHTSHNIKVGRIKQVTYNIRVKILLSDTLSQIETIINSILNKFCSIRPYLLKNWTVFYMSVYYNITHNKLILLYN